MFEAAVVALRLVQYTGAMILMGSALFYLYALPPSGDASAAQTSWARQLLVGAGLLLAVAAALGLVAQSIFLAGSVSEGLKVATLAAVVSGMNLGKAAVVRAVAAALAVICLLILKPGRLAWTIVAALRAVAATSLAWMGHGAATEGPLGPVHLSSDVMHALAAAVWIGALAGFMRLLKAPAGGRADDEALHRALTRFSGVGPALVALLVLTGLINSWILVGPERVSALWTTPYGRLLGLKLILFAAMLGLAAANRFLYAPSLGRALSVDGGSEAAREALRRSVLVETSMGVAVLALVAGFGTMPPPAAM